MNFLLVSASVLCGILLLEIGLRFFPEEKSAVLNERFLWDHWAHNPSYYFEAYNSFAKYDPTLGYIISWIDESEAEFIKGQGFRVLFLGDSITALQAYQSNMTQQLSKKYPKVTFNFLNVGVGGWDSLQEYMYLKTRINKLKPDMVILQFCMNDFGVTPVFWKDSTGKFYGYNVGPLGKYLKFNFVSYSHVAQRLLRLYLTHFPQQEFADREKVEKSLKGIAQLNEAHGHDFKIILFPSLKNPNSHLAKRYEMLQEIVAKTFAPEAVIDLLYLSDLENIEAWRDPPEDFTHPNEAGMKVMAEEIIKKIEIQTD